MPVTPKGELVDQLKQLGISERSAYYALKKSKNDVTKAANYGESKLCFFPFDIQIAGVTVSSFRPSFHFAVHSPASCPSGSSQCARPSIRILPAFNTLPPFMGHISSETIRRFMGSGRAARPAGLRRR
ncbi:hypothetical protein IAR55_003047 [Kwoniella newhampshirensis]|uniref:UBA domain-containing protein n=1 Tax=Kwoniella newhampshirensis TaxID=1651941 RepID=A0AAW0YPL1_9TREE